MAHDLVGTTLVSERRRTRVAARIVETEAYTGDDPASHSFAGRTARNASMFGPPGTLYVYLIYGMHHCLNVATGPEGEGSAVLFRAAEPVEGLGLMRRRRGAPRDRDLCAGPARLCGAFGLDRRHDGIDLTRSTWLWMEPGSRVPVETTPRIGVSRAADVAWRFVEFGSPWAS